MKQNKTFYIIMILIIFAGVYFVINKRKDDNSWKVEITNSYINVRKNHSAYEHILSKVNKGEKYKVIEIYLEDKKYVWYKIELNNGKEGWIASGRNEPYVREHNNPKTKNTNYKIDYVSPVIKYQDEAYETKSVDTIKFDHLDIEEDSEYDITYKVYKETKPEDRPGPQYWIKYVVVDTFGNRSSKIQRIIFEIMPLDEMVLDFSELKK